MAIENALQFIFSVHWSETWYRMYFCLACSIPFPRHTRDVRNFTSILLLAAHGNILLATGTALNISKLKKNTATAPQPFYNVLLFLRKVCIVWNLVRRPVTRRLTRLQTMYNVLKYSKTWWENDDISSYRYRTGTGNKLNLIMRMTVINLCIK